MINITKPTLLLDEEKAKKNILNMWHKAKANNLTFRPHFKTHQSAEIGLWFRELGVDRCTVSSLTMAKYFADAGWSDITVAFPANVLEHELIYNLARQCRLNLIVESVEVVESLATLIPASLGLFIKVDAGYHRTGILAHDWAKVEQLIDQIGIYPNFDFNGILVHNGHTYKCRGAEQIKNAHERSMDLLRPLMAKVKAKHPSAILSMGDTPTFSVMYDFDGFEEMRPGNFVFYDLTQVEIGSCSLGDIAVCMACPIVAKHNDRNQVILYGGGVHFSKDRVTVNDKEIYGLAVPLREGIWDYEQPIGEVVSLSQEHGILQVSPDVLSKIRMGEVIGVLPVHSCLAANLMGEYIITHGQRIGRL